MAEFLLENGADVNAQDKGGLIPLHNASSYGVSPVVLYQCLSVFLIYLLSCIFQHEPTTV